MNAVVSEQCSMRWENRISCETGRGHVGAHTNLTTGLRWWGQVLFDPVPGSLADRQHDNLAEPEIRLIRPDWADETEAILWAAWGDHAPEELQPLPVPPLPAPAPEPIRPVNPVSSWPYPGYRPHPVYQPVPRPPGRLPDRSRREGPGPGQLLSVVVGPGALLGICIQVIVGGPVGVAVLVGSIAVFGVVAVLVYQ